MKISSALSPDQAPDGTDVSPPYTAARGRPTVNAGTGPGVKV